MVRHFSRRLLVCWLITCLALAGCGTREARPRYRIVVIPKGTTHAFWLAIHAGARKAAEERGNVQIVWDGPPQEDKRAEQQQIVERFTAEGVDAIVLAPCDRQTLVAPVVAALKKGIPVVIIDSGLQPTDEIEKHPKYLGYVATDNLAGGMKAAERMQELFRNSERARVIMLPYQTGSESTEQRESGFKKGIGAAKNIEFLLAKDEAGATVATAQDAAERMLSNHPNLDGIFAPNESSTQGVLQALRATNRNGTIKLVGFDGSDILIAGLKAGDIHGLVLQDPFDMGYQGVMRAIDALEGKMPAQPTLSTNLRLATPANVDDPAVRSMYAPDLKKYLPK